MLKGIFLNRLALKSHSSPVSLLQWKASQTVWKYPCSTQWVEPDCVFVHIFVLWFYLFSFSLIFKISSFVLLCLISSRSYSFTYFPVALLLFPDPLHPAGKTWLMLVLMRCDSLHVSLCLCCTVVKLNVRRLVFEEFVGVNREQYRVAILESNVSPPQLRYGICSPHYTPPHPFFLFRLPEQKLLSVAFLVVL